MVIVQEAPEPRAADDRGIRPVVARGASLALDELAAQTLMETLGQVVCHELLHHVSQMALAEEDEVIQALMLDGLHESLGVWIAVWTLRRDLHAPDPFRFQDRRECLCEQGVSIVDEIARTAKKSIDWIDQVARDLLHPLPIGIDLNSRDLDRAGLDLDDEKDHVANRAEEPQSFDAEEVAGVQRVPAAAVGSSAISP